VPISPSQTLYRDNHSHVHRRPAHPWTGEVKHGSSAELAAGLRHCRQAYSIRAVASDLDGRGDAARAVGEHAMLDDGRRHEPGPELLPRLWPAGTSLALTDTGYFRTGGWIQRACTRDDSGIDDLKRFFDLRGRRRCDGMLFTELQLTAAGLVLVCDWTWYSVRGGARLENDRMSTESCPHEHGPSDRIFCRASSRTGPEAAFYVQEYGHVAAPNGVGTVQVSALRRPDAPIHGSRTLMCGPTLEETCDPCVARACEWVC